MLFREKRILECRGPIGQGAPQEVEGSLLVGDEPLFSFEEGFSQFGNDKVEVYPAFWQGRRAFLKKATREPAEGYSASGTEETILPYEQGIRQAFEGNFSKFSLGGKDKGEE